MRRCTQALVLVLALSTVTQAYHITGISVSPTNPTPNDSISVTVSGWKPATNYSIQRSVANVVGRTIMIDIYWQNPGCGGQVVTNYTRTESIGKRSSGAYTVSVRSYLNCAVVDRMTKAFTVAASCGCSCPCHTSPSLMWLCHCHCHDHSSTSSTSSNSTSSTNATGPSGGATAQTSGQSTGGGSTSTSSSRSQSIAN
jgi:hypothetical protein